MLQLSLHALPKCPNGQPTETKMKLNKATPQSKIKKAILQINVQESLESFN